MEYGEAISTRAKDRALVIARRKLTSGRSDIRAIATEAVSEAYCVCVVEGEDAAEGRLSPIHANLIEDIEALLSKSAADEEAR
jgi:hypothetical protein